MLSKYGIENYLEGSDFPFLFYNVMMKITHNIMTYGIHGLKKQNDFSGINMLLAEDIEINSEILVASLEHTNISIDVVQDGVMAVERFKRNPERYDIILMDVQMPIMNGLEATRNIRSLEFSKAKTIPIIAMTANVFKEDVAACIEAGMDDHLGKPIDIQTIISKISWYGKKRGL